MKKDFIKKAKRGFTLIELIVTIAIFAFMTAFLIAKYGKFNQDILLTNLAYDIALNIRTAQSYGVSVKSQDNTNNFDFPYGVYFDIQNLYSFLLFIDANNMGGGNYGDGNFSYRGADKVLNGINIKKNNHIKSLCVGFGSGCDYSVDTLSISFKRPDTSAIIKANGGSTKYSYAEIVLESSDEKNRKSIVVRGTGQIEIK